MQRPRQNPGASSQNMRRQPGSRNLRRSAMKAAILTASVTSIRAVKRAKKRRNRRSPSGDTPASKKVRYSEELRFSPLSPVPSQGQRAEAPSPPKSTALGSLLGRSLLGNLLRSNLLLRSSLSHVISLSWKVFVRIISNKTTMHKTNSSVDMENALSLQISGSAVESVAFNPHFYMKYRVVRRFSSLA